MYRNTTLTCAKYVNVNMIMNMNMILNIDINIEMDVGMLAMDTLTWT
jgi:hypothetical protein